MRLAFLVHVILTLLMLKPAKNQPCDKVSINAWCPRNNTYLRKAWTTGNKEGRCCVPDDPSYANQPATCLEKSQRRSGSR